MLLNLPLWPRLQLRSGSTGTRSSSSEFLKNWCPMMCWVGGITHQSCWRRLRTGRKSLKTWYHYRRAPFLYYPDVGTFMIYDSKIEEIYQTRQTITLKGVVIKKERLWSRMWRFAQPSHSPCQKHLHTLHQSIIITSHNQGIFQFIYKLSWTRQEEMILLSWSV